jgi:N-methylhydantoinase A
MAAGIVRVVDAHMADLVRRVTVERGHDPRNLLLVAYGGAAGLHAAAYGFDAGATEVVLPVGAGVFSARGLAAAERGRGYVRPGPLVAPFPLAEVRAAYAAMERRARAEFRGVELELRREIDLRYRRQTHRLRIPVGPGRLERTTLDDAIASFEREYERVYGREAGYAGAGVEAVAFRLAARPIVAPGTERRPGPRASAPHRRATRRRARAAHRRAVYFDRWVEGTPVVDGASARTGDVVEGPAVAEWPTTTLLVPPGFEASIDERGNARLVRAR